MQKSSEHDKSWHYLTYGSPNLKHCSEVRSPDKQYKFTIKF